MRISPVEISAEKERRCEVSAPRTDRRTKAGRRAEIIAEVEECGGFSVFWITEHKLRAIVGTEMMQSGELVETQKSSFPSYCLKVVLRSNGK
jgi:hypothetical protein